MQAVPTSINDQMVRPVVLTSPPPMQRPIVQEFDMPIPVMQQQQYMQEQVLICDTKSE